MTKWMQEFLGWVARSITAWTKTSSSFICFKRTFFLWSSLDLALAGTIADRASGVLLKPIKHMNSMATMTARLTPSKPKIKACWIDWKALYKYHRIIIVSHSHSFPYLCGYRLLLSFVSIDLWACPYAVNTRHSEAMAFYSWSKQSSDDFHMSAANINRVCVDLCVTFCFPDARPPGLLVCTFIRFPSLFLAFCITKLCPNDCAQKLHRT